jgi:4-diphosphocytidyl-2-C-methyl-D-erythritol kinase
VEEWKDSVVNDFEGILFPKYPLIKDLKSAFYDSGAVFSSMSGSGSTVFGIYIEKPVIPEFLEKYVILESPL